MDEARKVRPSLTRVPLAIPPEALLGWLGPVRARPASYSIQTLSDPLSLSPTMARQGYVDPSDVRKMMNLLSIEVTPPTPRGRSRAARGPPALRLARP